MLASLDAATHMSDEGLDKFVRMSHIGEDESKVVLRCSQQVRTEHDSERFRCHVVLLLKVGDSGCNSKVNALFLPGKRRTCRGVQQRASVNQSWHVVAHERHIGCSTTVHADFPPL